MRHVSCMQTTSCVLNVPATIFAYGQTGSGKTHTMMGGKTPDGIIPRLNSQLFDEIQVSKNADFCVQSSVINPFRFVR